jgi:hypothetical protein
MAYEIANSVLKITLVAAADLRAKKYQFVKLDSAGKAAAVSGLTDKPIGILQNEPNTGEECEVLVIGGSKLVAGVGGLTEGAAVKTSATGLGIALTVGTDTSHYLVGQSLTEVVETGYATVVINCASAGRGA